MPSSALLLALGAAGLHALWNVLLAGARDTDAAAAVMLLASALLFAPIAAVTWRVEWEAAPYIAGSSAFELAYFALLARAYRRSELSLVYPLARGLAPSWCSRSRRSRSAWRPAPPGPAAPSSSGSACCSFEASAALPTRAASCSRSRSAPVSPPTRCSTRKRPRTIVAALALFGAYALVLVALDLAPAAPVAAVRESSVLIATLLAVFVLGERVSPARAGGAALIVAGIVLVGLS